LFGMDFSEPRPALRRSAYLADTKKPLKPARLSGCASCPDPGPANPGSPAPGSGLEYTNKRRHTAHRCFQSTALSRRVVRERPGRAVRIPWPEPRNPEAKGSRPDFRETGHIPPNSGLPLPSAWRLLRSSAGPPDDPYILAQRDSGAVSRRGRPSAQSVTLLQGRAGRDSISAPAEGSPVLAATTMISYSSRSRDRLPQLPAARASISEDKSKPVTA